MDELSEISSNKKLLWWSIVNMHSRLVEQLSVPEEVDICKQIVSKTKILKILSTHCPREIFFQKQKKDKGSEYFFHGSALNNWYSILKFGLINISKKQGLMLHGAAYGEGIYMSKVFSTAESYKSTGHVGIIEVIKGCAVEKIKTIHTLVDDKMVRVRYIVL
jgi:hypothetical protein